jgi:hypothetical protein
VQIVSVPDSAELSIVARERLRILAIGFYIRGGVILAFSCFFLFYVAMLLAFSFIPESAWNNHPPAPPRIASLPLVSPTPTPAPHSNPGAPSVMVFRIMAGVMGGMMLLGWVIGGLTAYAGRCIQKRKHRVLIYVMAALNCLFIPYGTLLGVFSFIVLGSPGAIEEFKAPAQSSA